MDQITIGAHTFRLIRNSDGTYTSEPVLPQGKSSSTPSPEEDKLLGKFESFSLPGTFYYVKQSPEGTIHCSCPGFGYRKTCKHYLFIKEIGPEKITAPIVITQKDVI